MKKNKLALFDLDDTLFDGDTEAEWVKYMDHRGFIQDFDFYSKMEAFEKNYISGCTPTLESLVQVVKRAESLYGEKSGETVYTEQPGIFQIVLRSELVDDTIDELLPLLSEGDIIIDYSDSVVDKCQEIEHYCSKLGISYIFSGTYGASYAISTCSKIFECLSPGKIS